MTAAELLQEAERIDAEARKLRAEAGKLSAEREKLLAEREKFMTERWYLPLMAGAAVGGVVVALAGAVAGFLIKLA